MPRPRIVRHGLADAITKSINLGCSFVLLQGGKFALVDNVDLPKVTKYAWLEYNSGVRARIKTKLVALHRLIMNVWDRDILVDHRNRDKLDNRRCNLRICNYSQNNGNSIRRKHNSTSKYKGVKRDTRRKNGKWHARININRRSIHLGTYNTEEEAAAAYDAASLIHYGEFHRPNFTNMT